MMKTIFDNLIKNGYQPIKRNGELEKVNPPNTGSHVKKSDNLIIDMNINFEQINEFLNKHKGDNKIMITVEEQRTMQAIQQLNRKIPEVTLRDLFAMCFVISGKFSSRGSGSYIDYDYGEWAYKYADVMLEARKQ